MAQAQGNLAHRTGRTGFTLVEVLIVIVILAILAAIALPHFAGVSKSAEQAAFIREVKIYADAAMVFRVRTGGFLEPENAGAVPAGFGEYVDESDWVRPTPIGGLWDCLLNELGIVAAIGVTFGEDAPDDAYMLEIDQSFDDGALETGMFRKLADGQFCYVIEAD